jgi:hypothetical protein
MNHWVYSAVITAIGAAFLGLIVGAAVIRRVFLGHRPRPAVSLLLVSLLGLSLSQLIEQSRVLFFRASFDGHLEPSMFLNAYNATWNVASSKVIMAMSLTAAAAVKLGLYCDREDSTIVRWALWAALGTLAGWAILAAALDPLI